jgi:hypothetical protein
MSKLVQIVDQRKTFKRAEKVKQEEYCLRQFMTYALEIQNQAQ